MSNSIEISIIIPVYNEEVGLKKTLNRMKEILNNESYETIIVNDGSSDSTSDVLKEFKGIMVIDHENNHGYGASLKTGIKKHYGSPIGPQRVLHRKDAYCTVLDLNFTLAFGAKIK